MARPSWFHKASWAIFLVIVVPVVAWAVDITVSVAKNTEKLKELDKIDTLVAVNCKMAIRVGLTKEDIEEFCINQRQGASKE